MAPALAQATVLVAIASYGRGQDTYLAQVVAEYRRLGDRCRIVVLSDRPKPVEGAEVLAGVPARNPRSLPFAHRRLFAEHADAYDLFVYSEDDTLLTPAHIEAFLQVQQHLAGDEIAGFVRSERAPDGRRFITSIHHHFRWLPGTVTARGGELFAALSNQHSGCFVATRAQLQRALASGGFLVPPHEGAYGMLESAATDIYRRCGLRRVICLSRVSEFVVPHLPNKYCGEMGVPIELLELQVQQLRGLYCEGGWTGALFDPETRAPGFRWSRDLYEPYDESLVRAIPRTARRLLSVGAALGELESRLVREGLEVVAMPIDGLFGRLLRRRGLETVEGSLEQAAAQLPGGGFDVVLLADVLHLVDDPVGWLRALRRMLAPAGVIVASVGNTGNVAAWLRDLRAGHLRRRLPRYATSRVQPVSRAGLRRWCRSSGLQPLAIAPGGHAGARPPGAAFIAPVQHLVADTLILTARAI